MAVHTNDVVLLSSSSYRFKFCENLILEDNINNLKSYLENSGYNVKMTRYDDYDLASKNSKNRKNIKSSFMTNSKQV